MATFLLSDMIQPPDPAAVFGATLDFERYALHSFRYQAAFNPVYRQFTEALGVDPHGVDRLTAIPFLPIQFFKTHDIRTGPPNDPASLVFYSSGTTGAERSRHHVPDPDHYRKCLLEGFQRFYGPPGDYHILALVPPDAKTSSLAFMMHELIGRSGSALSGFYFSEHENLEQALRSCGQDGKPCLLIGLTWALFDFSAFVQRRGGSPVSPGAPVRVMETGGMKGRHKELVREALHQVLCNALGVPVIHSEYGMTELMSQAYSSGNGIFRCPPWMRVFIRDVNDPGSLADDGKTGGINVIDLANLHSCSFIATQDLGRKYADGSFEVLGRFDNSDLRGCSLMMA